MGSVFRQLSGTIGVFIFMIGLAPDSLAQENKTLDSLQSVVKNAKNDTIKIKALSELSELCDEEDILKYAAECSTLCEKAIASGKQPKLFYLKKLAQSVNNTGYYYSHHNNVEEALAHYKRALVIEEKLGDKKELAIQMNNLATILYVRGDFSQALDYFFKGLKIQEEIGDKIGTVVSLNHIGNAYNELSDYPKALNYFTRALDLCKGMNDKEGLAQSLFNTGLTYLLMNDEEKALDLYNQSLNTYEKIGNEYGISSVLSAIGGLQIDLKKQDEAIPYLLRSLEISDKHGYVDVSSQSLFRIALVLTKQGKYKEALPYAERSLKLAKQTGMIKQTHVAAGLLQRIYSDLHKFKEAYTMLEFSTRMRDSVINETNRKNAIRQELQYEYEKKELRTKLIREKELSAMKIENERKLARRNTILYIVVSLVILLGISIFFLYKFFRQRNIITASRNNELRRKLLLNQMNPHFIFNSVDNIQGLIHNKQDKEAISYLSKFSKLTRQILENSNEDHIALVEELNTIENYLTIQQLLYNNNFAFTIEVDESIDKENVLVPPMLTQPFVENAIKHGLKNKKEGGLVQVKFYMKEGSLFFEVSDNGSGLEEKIQSGHKSMSTRIAKERLNTSAKKEIAISTRNRIENNEIKGVVTSFEIPYTVDA
jgi:tetratricopeptide (TPR) repeat protein